MTISQELTLTGSTVNGSLSSFFTILGCQPLYMFKTSIMTGKGIPAINRTLYRGYPVNAFCDITNQSVAFFSNNFFATVIMKSKPLSPGEQILGGFFSGMAASPLLCMSERIMIIQQVHTEGSVSKKALAVTQVVKKILQHEGVLGFLRGLAPTMMRESANAACFFGLQKTIHFETKKWVKNEQAASSTAFLISGLFAGMVTTPADLIKTNMQATLGDSSSFVAVANKLMKENGRGIAGLAKGCFPRTIMIGSLMTSIGFFSTQIPKVLPKSLFVSPPEIPV